RIDRMDHQLQELARLSLELTCFDLRSHRDPFFTTPRRRAPRPPVAAPFSLGPKYPGAAHYLLGALATRGGRRRRPSGPPRSSCEGLVPRGVLERHKRMSPRVT